MPAHWSRDHYSIGQFEISCRCLDKESEDRQNYSYTENMDKPYENSENLQHIGHLQCFLSRSFAFSCYFNPIQTGGAGSARADFERL